MMVPAVTCNPPTGWCARGVGLASHCAAGVGLRCASGFGHPAALGRRSMRANLLNLSLAVALAASPAAVRAGPAEDQYAVAAGHYNQKRWKLAAEEFQTFLKDF